MASLRMHLTNAFIRTTVKPWLDRRNDLDGERAFSVRVKLPVPRGAEFREIMMGRVVGERVSPRRPSAAEPPLLYLHGGGYFTGSPKAHRPITASLAKRGFTVFVPDYRLAPEHPYPAAVDDAEAAWDALTALGHRDIAVAGDSAGGGLALALIHRLRAKRKRLPFAAALFSPWTDLLLSGDSLSTNAPHDLLFSVSGVRMAAKWYLDGADPRCPEASPLHGSLRGFPPLFIEVGEQEILRDDSVRLAERAWAHGVNATLNRWPGVFHAWQLACSFLPEGRGSLDQTALFLHQTRAMLGGTIRNKRDNPRDVNAGVRAETAPAGIFASRPAIARQFG